MRRLTCPKCQNIVAVEEGAAPVCPQCGFGAPGAGLAGDPGPQGAARGHAEAAAGAAARHPNLTDPPSASRGRAKAGLWIGLGALVLLVAIAATVVLLLGGTDAGLSQAEANERAQQALLDLSTDVIEGNDLRLMTGSVEIPPDPENPFAAGGASFDIEMELGAQDARRMSIGLSGGGISARFVVYCTEDGVTSVFGDQAVLARPGPDGCASFFDDEERSDAPIQTGLVGGLDRPEDAELTDAIVHENGTIEAHFRTDTDSIGMWIDRDGRATRIAFEGPEGHGTFTMTYGAPHHLDVPEATAREPLGTTITTERDVQGATLTFSAADAQAPLDEFEVRVLNGSAVVAAFPLEQGSGTVGGLSFTVTDQDGLLGDGDIVTIEGDLEPGWQVKVHDEWAELAIGESAALPGAPWLLLAAGLAVLAWRRRA